MHTKTTRSLLLSLTAAAALATAATADTLKFGNEGTNPPFSMVASDGTLTGLEPDLAREACKRMGDECEFVVMDFMALVPSLLQGKFDLLVGNMTPSAERKEKLAFTRPVLANPVTYVVPADSDWTMTPEGLKGKGVRVGLQRGDLNAKFIEETYGDTIEYSYYDNPDQTILDLTAGRINMLFMPKMTAALRLIDTDEGADWKFAGEDFYIGQEDLPLDERGNAWAVRKGNDALVTKINAALDEMLADCTYTEIRSKYISTPLLPQDATCAAGE
ncbi:Histidine-binding periplasmic protein precursor (plasmid) [Marinibacterium anthonyi]|nr:Histidine-binding periplasmic protein precursor [Marinibacterium anthonyi]